MTILVSDLDGTLLESNNNLPNNIRHFVDKLNHNGVTFSIATARSAQNVVRLFKPLQLDYYAFCSNGGVTINVENNKTSFINEDVLSESAINELFNIIQQAVDMSVLLFSTSKNSFKIYIINNGKIPKKVFSKLFIDRSWEIININYLEKIKNIDYRAISILSKDSNLQKYNSPENFNCISFLETRFFNSEYSWVEFLPVETNKGNALQSHVNKYKFNRIYALGDGENDLELFKMADKTFCPIRSHPELIQKSDFVINTTCGEAFIDRVINIII